MKILRTKNFGAVKQANKAAKKAWEIMEGGKIAKWGNAVDLRKKQVGRAMRYAKSSGSLDLTLANNLDGSPIQTFFYNGPRNVHTRINSKALYKSMGDEKTVRDIVKDKIGNGVDYYLSKSNPVDNRLRDRYEFIRKGTKK